MKNLSYEEIDLLWEILNFKIISIDYIYENYKMFIGIKDKERKLKGILKKLNDILIQLEILPFIDKNKEMIYCYSPKLEYKKIEYSDKLIYKYSIRQEMISLILLLNRKKFSIAKFLKDINKEEKDRKHIKKDLRKVLKKYNIKYEEYMKNENPTFLIKQKIENYSEEQYKILKEILIKRLEKTYYNSSSKVESKLIYFISRELEIKYISYTYKKYLEFLEKYNMKLSKNSEYNIFTYLILNLNNNKVNISKRVKKNDVLLKKDKNYELIDEMLKKISKKENIKIYTNFKIKLYKLLLKIERNEELFYREMEFNNNRRILYKIEEDEIRNVSKKYKILKESTELINEKLKILLVLDIEKQKYIKYKEEIILVLFSIFKVINIMSMKELRKELKISKCINVEYDQILIISNIMLQNMIENRTNKPIYFINIKEENKNKTQCKKKFLEQIIQSNNLMQNYNKIKKFIY